ncbi:peptidoglycan/LPS O-acetylase OafA/YrhL [Motilibacter rhizosphaerae]|uniref:Peptidoglycan/LPS O-acetylase OafA/YrhL n=1 Tax=Motilibacter rhizosphaerae TaxID=598652 RepID=A0A4Q7NWA6_9ACTN|nr:peptidoglycan/LPS O-acetylase OafA/YrhL [Motilibacter rhizosphaerae]
MQSAAPAGEQPVTAPSAPNRLGYRPGLDGVRGLAILLVMVHHAGITALLGGHVGVTVFFTLSGFLITTLLLEERQLTGRIDLAAFYLRRAARLLPALVVVLAVATVSTLVVLGRDGWSAIGWGAGSALLYCSNIIGILEPDVAHVQIFGWAWSLSMEEQFYVVWPSLIVAAFLLRRRPLVVLSAVAAVLTVLSVAEKLSMGTPQGWNGHLYLGPDTRGDALLVGCLLGLALHARAGRRAGSGTGRLRPLVAGVAGVVGLVLLAGVVHEGLVGDARTYHYGLPATALATVGLVLAVLDAPRSPVARLLALRPLVRAGQVSYGLYLWNFPLLWFWEHHRGAPITHREAVVWFVATYVVAELSYRLVEQPVIERNRAHLRARRERRAGRQPLAPAAQPA